jgi:uncharacterized glyoxalase superfamily protein PhnB
MATAAAQKITTFLMFEGRAEEAISHYTSLFDDAEVIDLTRYGADGPGVEGTVQRATFALAGQRFMCIDSYVRHEFGFTPAVSLRHAINISRGTPSGGKTGRICNVTNSHLPPPFKGRPVLLRQPIVSPFFP